jgi:predicted ATPase
MAKPLDKIEAHGFKSIRSMSLGLKSLNILIGSNGAGKSNFISLFKLLNEIAAGHLQVYVATSGGANSLLHFGRKKTTEINIEISLGNQNYGYECILVPTADDRLIFKYEDCWFEDTSNNELSDIDLGRGHAESGLVEQPQTIFEFLNEPEQGEPEHDADKQRITEGYREASAEWKVYHFNDTSDTALIKATGDLDDNLQLRPDAGNLAAFLYRLKEKNPANYTNIVDATRLVLPFFDDFTLEPSRLNEDKIRLEWRERDSVAYFNASALSDGSLRFICLATLLLQPDLPSTILLDEPELGLHPYAITILAELLRGAATKTQVIASTQSVSLVNQFEPEDVIVVEREDQQSVFRHLDRADMQSWLDEYGLGDLWEKNLIGGRP